MEGWRVLMLRWTWRVLVGVTSLIGCLVVVSIPYVMLRYCRVHATGFNMAPTLYSGSYVMGDKWNRQSIQRGDIIIYRRPVMVDATTVLIGDPPKGFSIGRVVGLPGERIQIQTPRLLVNGRELEGIFAWIAYEPSPDGQKDTFLVPEEHLFVLGDNPAWSFDSRFWGSLPQASVLAKVVSIRPDGDHRGQTQESGESGPRP